eukprot:GHVO01045133.1.p1 GENE.GHVO01045133.1~~GHVO01045133.1.p1  ORF type:complete len:157 (-),score=6.91 GHVO01045133.1:164-634(-)
MIMKDYVRLTETIGPSVIMTTFLVVECKDGPKVLISFDDILDLGASVGRCLQFSEISSDPHDTVSYLNTDPALNLVTINNIEDLQPDLKETVLQLHPLGKLGKCKVYIHSIELTDDKPIFTRLRPYSPQQRQAIDDQLDSMLELGVTRVSTSPFLR